MDNIKKIIIIGVSVFLLAIALLFTLNYFLEEPKIVDSTPKNNSLDNEVDKPTFTISFNMPQTLTKNDLTIMPAVKGNWTSSKNHKDMTFVADESLSVLTDYLITVNMKSRLGKEFVDIIGFKTKFVYFNDLPADLLKKEMDATDACADGRKPKKECPSEPYF